MTTATDSAPPMEHVRNFNRVVVGVDFSQSSLVALDHAVQLARQSNAVISLALASPTPRAVHRDEDGQPAATLDEKLLGEIDTARRALEQLAEQKRQEGCRVDHVFIDNDPVPGLANAAKELGADLIVVGSRGLTGIKRFLLGSVAERTIRLSECHSMVARGRAPRLGYRRVLVPTDFSKTSERALQLGLSLADDGAEVELLHCALRPSFAATPLPEHALSTPSPHTVQAIEDAAIANGEKLRGRYRTDRVDLGFSHSRMVAPAGIIDRLDDEGPYDLVVMGSHGRRGWRRWILGSVAEVTARHAPCSVVVVHSDGDYDE